MSLDINIFINYWPEVGQGFLVTIMITIGALLVGLPLGMALALAKLADVPAVRWPAIACIEVIRNTPFMIQVFLIFYVLPFYGIRMPSWLVGIVSLGIFSSVYYAEIIRAGIESVPRGQMEAARATGMSYGRGMRHIVFPQMLGFVLPPTANQTLSLVKESAILSTITVSEMTYTALRIQGETFSPFEVFLMIAALYWLLNEVIATLIPPPRAPFGAIEETDNAGPARTGGSSDHVIVNGPATGANETIPAPLVRIEAVEKRFGRVEALRGVDLEVNRGEVVCIIGPSGCGKSTLLRCINGLHLPDGGRCRVDGHEIADFGAAAGSPDGAMRTRSMHCGPG